ncbi:MAG: sulfurtransferase [Deltaproteobacteria bacterium]|nr:sulfurtransferase [Deltaproteobacteria bacterium]MBW2306831.1 sulfurtransferase [Deltaproteobacteria bacterium]
MKKSVIVGIVLVVSSLLIFTGLAWSVEFPAKIIKAEWLKANMDKIPSLRIVDLRSAEAYAKGHIPGAVNLPYKQLRVKVMDVSSVRRPPEVWEKLMGRQLGIEETDTVAVYTGKKAQEAGRFVWEFNYYGHENVAMVNGGYDAWVKAGGTVSTDTPKVTPKLYMVRKINHDLLATNHFIMKHLKDPRYVVIDDRSFQQYSGAQAGKGIKRAGHIPGAINIPLGKWMKDGYLLPPEKIVELLDSKGIKKDQTIIMTCRTGNKTCGPYILLSAMGYNVRVHDYSWTGWNEEKYLPAEK